MSELALLLFGNAVAIYEGAPLAKCDGRSAPDEQALAPVAHHGRYEPHGSRLLEGMLKFDGGAFNSGGVPPSPRLRTGGSPALGGGLGFVGAHAEPTTVTPWAKRSDATGAAGGAG